MKLHQPFHDRFSMPSLNFEERRGQLTFGLWWLLSRVELTTDVHEPSLQLQLFLQSKLFSGFASHIFTCWTNKRKKKIRLVSETSCGRTAELNFSENLTSSLTTKLLQPTIRLPGFLPQTRHDVSF